MPDDIGTEGQENRSEESVVEEEKTGKKVSAKKYALALEELEKAKVDRDHWKNEYYKAYADTQNLRRSLEAEQREIKRYRAEGVMADLLPSLDAFHLALESPAPNREVENYRIGFTYIYNQIITALNNEGLVELAPKLGEPFDINYMNAIDAVETDEYPPNTVMVVHSKAYKLFDHLIKAANVTVAKAKKVEEEPKNESKEDGAKPVEA